MRSALEPVRRGPVATPDDDLRRTFGEPVSCATLFSLLGVVGAALINPEGSLILLPFFAAWTLAVLLSLRAVLRPRGWTILSGLAVSGCVAIGLLTSPLALLGLFWYDDPPPFPLAFLGLGSAVLWIGLVISWLSIVFARPSKPRLVTLWFFLIAWAVFHLGATVFSGLLM